MEKYITKYPVVLVHGMFIKDFKLHRAFRKIKDKLIEKGVKVYVTNQDGIGSINNNARQLKEIINDILKKENVDKVNLIAHSKGGLDCRYLISKLNMEDHVASLTTLSTPHRGSKMSNRLLSMPKWCAKFIAFWINLAYKILKDKKPNIIHCAYDVTDENMERLNKELINSPKVYYQSYSADAEDKSVSIITVPYAYSTLTDEGATDGIVSVESSKWGEYKGNIGLYDHCEMVGFYGSKKTLEEVSEFYLHVVSVLVSLGF